MSEKRNTGLPWENTGPARAWDSEYEISSETDSFWIAHFRTKEDADLCVTAVNCHDDLLAALKIGQREVAGLLEWLGPCEHEVNKCSCVQRGALEAIEAALAKAEPTP